ncbi:diphthamide biosynthesis protein 2 [Coccidioides immitis H538.4]|uniref:Diphthamide biosynthesis protein 2 n=1 Tax=Coccidioides immitis H538.4 TaxID=396776 RepID=A0A0J8RGA9_COCIT|nr:diphthamide biosynthesis protein 2 [Coccidioides immitis H538.4]
MASSLEVAPVLSTPDDHILEATDPLVTPRTADQVSDEELRITYDIERTIRDIKQGRWRRIALQFPDEMLPDAPRVFQLLSRGLESVDPHLYRKGHKLFGKNILALLKFQATG